MLKLSPTDDRAFISRDFFCDGPGYVMTSQSLGGSGLTAAALSEIFYEDDDEKILELVRKGVCLPVRFDGDCALDGATRFVFGDLSEDEARHWIGRLGGRLNIPCGRFKLVCGYADDELVSAASGEPPDPNYVCFETVEVPPGEYLVEIYAYFSSMTVQVSLSHWNEEGERVDDKEREDRYRADHPGLDGVDYVIRFQPLEGDAPAPALEDGWLGKFEFR